MPVFQPFGKASKDLARPILADLPQQFCQTNEASHRITSEALIYVLNLNPATLAI